MGAGFHCGRYHAFPGSASLAGHIHRTVFATLVSSGGNRRLPLAALNNRDFVVWTGHFVSLLSLIGGRGGVLPPHFGQKKAGDLFQISCSVCRYVGGGYLIVKVRGKLTRCEADKLEFILANHLPL